VGEVVVISGTGTEIGKTIVTAAIAACAANAGKRVAVVKPVQTGLPADAPGDLAEVTRLSGVTATFEFARYPDPLSPEAAARVSGRAAFDVTDAVAPIREISAAHDLVLVEGAGGLLVRFDPNGKTLADLARALDAPVVVVTRPDLGTLNHTALTLEALRNRGLALADVIVGSYPASGDRDHLLACRCNLEDLPVVIGHPLGGVLPAGCGALSHNEFAVAAHAALTPRWGGTFDTADFLMRTHDLPEERTTR